MAPYIILLIILLILLVPQAVLIETYATTQKNSKRVRLAEIVSVILLICFSGARYFVGTDTLLYTLIFARIDPKNWVQTIRESTQEVGYTAFSLLLKMLSDNPQILFASAAALTVFLAYFSIDKLSPNAAYSLILYVIFAQYLAPMNVIRQGLSVAIIYAGVSFYKKNRLATFILWAIAVSFHSSAILAIPIILLARSVKINLCIFLGWLVAGSFVVRVLVLDLPFVGNVAGAINPRYADYLASTHGAGLGSYLLAVVFIILGVVATRVNLTDPTEIWIRNIFLFTAPFAIFGTRTVEAMRVSDYFSFAIVILLPILVRRASGAKLPLQLMFATLGFLFFSAYLSNYGGLLPYQDYFGILDRSGLVYHIPK